MQNTLHTALADLRNIVTVVGWHQAILSHKVLARRFGLTSQQLPMIYPQSLGSGRATAS